MLNSEYVARLIQLALDEDLDRGDVTTQYLEPHDKEITAYILAKEELVPCGLNLVKEVSKKNAKQPKLLFLRVTKDMAYALNPFDQSVKIIQEMKTSNSKKRVCEVGELQ